MSGRPIKRTLRPQLRQDRSHRDQQCDPHEKRPHHHTILSRTGN